MGNNTTLTFPLIRNTSSILLLATSGYWRMIKSNTFWHLWSATSQCVSDCRRRTAWNEYCGTWWPHCRARNCPIPNGQWFAWINPKIMFGSGTRTAKNSNLVMMVTRKIVTRKIRSTGRQTRRNWQLSESGKPKNISYIQSSHRPATRPNPIFIPSITLSPAIVSSTSNLNYLISA